MSENNDKIEKVKSSDYKVNPYTIETNDKVLKIEGGRRIETKANMGVFLKLFGDSIYNSDSSAFREQLTNALSHGCMPSIAAGNDAHVEVEVDYTKRRIMVTDVNGMGIPWNLMNEVCTNIGESGNHDRSRSGQHGCGMFSFLKMTSTTILETKARETDDHYAYIREGGRTWDEIGNRELKNYGTRVQLTVNENVNLDKIIKATRDICMYQPVKTYLSVIGSPTEELNISNYGRTHDDNIQWFKGDGMYEFGNKSYEEGVKEQFNNQVTEIVKLDSKDMEIYVGLPNRNIGSYGGNADQTRMFLCNVPLGDNISSHGFSTIWVNLTNEKTWKPPVDRDSLNDDDLDRIRTYVSDAINDWVGTISIKDFDEFKKHQFASLLNVPAIDEKLPEETRTLFHELRRTWKVWNSGGKDRSEAFGNLLKNGNCFLVPTWSTTYYDAFRRHFGAPEKFTLLKLPNMKRYTVGTDIWKEKQADIEYLEKHFEYAKAYKKRKGISLSFSRTSNRLDNGSVKTINVRSSGNWNMQTEPVRITDLNKTHYVKIPTDYFSWSTFYGDMCAMNYNLLEHMNHHTNRNGHTLYGSDILRKCNLNWIGNNTYAKYVDPLVTNLEEFIDKMYNHPILENLEGETVSLRILAEDTINEQIKKFDECECETCESNDGKWKHEIKLVISTITKEMIPYVKEYRDKHPIQNKPEHVTHVVEVFAVFPEMTSAQILENADFCKWLVALESVNKYHYKSLIPGPISKIAIQPLNNYISKMNLENSFSNIMGMPSHLPPSLTEKLQKYKEKIKEIIPEEHSEKVYNLFTFLTARMFNNINENCMYHEHNGKLTQVPTVKPNGVIVRNNNGMEFSFDYRKEGRWDENHKSCDSFEHLADEIIRIIGKWYIPRIELVSKGINYYLGATNHIGVNFYEGNKPILLTGKNKDDLILNVKEWQERDDSSFRLRSSDSNGYGSRIAYRKAAPRIPTKNVIEIDSKIDNRYNNQLTTNELKIFKPCLMDLDGKIIEEKTGNDLLVKVGNGENERLVRLDIYETLYYDLLHADMETTELFSRLGNLKFVNMITEGVNKGNYGFTSLANIQAVSIFGDQDIGNFLRFLNDRYATGIPTWKGGWKVVSFNLGRTQEAFDIIADQIDCVDSIKIGVPTVLMSGVKMNDENNMKIILSKSIEYSQISKLRDNSQLWNDRYGQSIQIEIENVDGEPRMVINEKIDWIKHCNLD